MSAQGMHFSNYYFCDLEYEHPYLYRSSPKKVKVSASVAQPVASVISRPVVKQARRPAIPKRESHTPFMGDELHGSGTHIHDLSQTVKSRDAHQQAESSDDEHSGTTHTFGCVLELLRIDNMFIFDTVALHCLLLL